MRRLPPSRETLAFGSLAAVLLTLGALFRTAESVAECMSGNSVKCFECNSREDFRCNDPFNWTTLPPVEDCTGCCVKMVQEIGTQSAILKRTCTTHIRINFFMVGHVCMSESNNRGHMCFCEADLCNGACSLLPSAATSMLSILLAWKSSR
eukprot:TRINITY_DN5164_c0_g1_i2.p1 TRINITY_DN5164_c0_g1~~TRINITY_DN5164_c0_g1_i2.p1  ORF type:complete len:151 (-),score=27.08 TRINITY_DN5164_c0_g1_i2:838-1290(-)